VNLIAALTPSAAQIANWHLFSMVLLGLVGALYAIYLLCEWGMDHVVARALTPRKPVIDFTERRRLLAIKAIAEDGR
jgi:hypothetical protein